MYCSGVNNLFTTLLSERISRNILMTINNLYIKLNITESISLKVVIKVC
jgi:hypothetical protein